MSLDDDDDDSGAESEHRSRQTYKIDQISAKSGALVGKCTILLVIKLFSEDDIYALVQLFLGYT